MKRLSKIDRIRHKQFMRSIQRRRLRQTRRGRRLRLAHSKYVHIEAPKIFCLQEQHSRARVVKFLRRVRKHLLGDGRRLLVDFSQTNKFVADGTLLLFAELNRARLILGTRISLRCVPPQNRKAAQVMVQVGLAKLFNCSIKAKVIDDDVVKWRAASGTNVDGRRYDDILSSGYEGQITEALHRRLFNGISEAMNNTVHHAHAQHRDDEFSHYNDIVRWWMFSQEREGKLHVVICDLGIGIPRSIRTEKKHRGLLRLLRYLSSDDDDAEVISNTIRYSESSTGRKERGKGLGKISQCLADYPQSRVSVYSNRGLVCYEGTTVRKSKTFEESIMGTLIAWTVPIPAGV